MELAPEVRALLALFDHLPYSQRLDDEADSLIVQLRSSRTHSEMVRDMGWDTADPATRWHHGRAIEAAESDPDGYWQQSWPLTQPRRDGWAADWTVEQWAAHESAQFPAGFYPVGLGQTWVPGYREIPAELADEIRDELRSGTIEAVREAAARVTAAGDALREAQAYRDRAIRAALAAGVSASSISEASGVNRARVYQIKGA